MHKRLTILGVLFAAVGIVYAQSTPQNDQHPAGNVTVVVNPAAAAPAGDEAETEIARFTRQLVVVGALQAVALIFTLVVAGRQARLMGRHAEHLQTLGDAAKRNAEAALKQANLMEGQLREMQAAGERAAAQLAMTESEMRAYLAAGVPNTAVSGETRVPIENHGKMAARVIRVTRTHLQFGKDGEVIFRSESIDAPTASIRPGAGGDYAIFIQTQPSTTATGGSAIMILLEYDTGFGKTDRLSACFSLDPRGEWVRGNSIGTSDEGQEKPD
jgi:hypothetical protein